MPPVVFSLSGLKASARAELQDYADRLGITYQPVLDGKCTHLVSDTVLSDKYAGAVKSRLPVVGPDWLRESARAGCLQPEASYLLPPCHGLRIVVTGHGFLQVGSAIACPHLGPHLSAIICALACALTPGVALCRTSASTPRGWCARSAARSPVRCGSH